MPLVWNRGLPPGPILSEPKGRTIVAQWVQRAPRLSCQTFRCEVGKKASSIKKRRRTPWRIAFWGPHVGPWRPSSLTRYINGRTASREENSPTPFGGAFDDNKQKQAEMRRKCRHFFLSGVGINDDHPASLDSSAGAWAESRRQANCRQRLYGSIMRRARCRRLCTERDRDR
jgi:hypothetical protein